MRSDEHHWYLWRGSKTSSTALIRSSVAELLQSGVLYRAYLPVAVAGMATTACVASGYQRDVLSTCKQR